MKKLIYLVAAIAAVSFASCKNEPTEILDPVCKMVKADTWVDSAISHNTTFYFCSPVCKEQFEKDPHKYMGEHAH